MHSVDSGLSSSPADVTPSLSRYFIERGFFEAVRRHARGGARCLNLGAGPHGRYAELFAGIVVQALDIVPAEGVQPWPYQRADAAHLPFPDTTFDLVVAVEAFEHIEENHRAMAEVARVMKPGAVLVMTTPTFWTWPFELGTHGPHYYSSRTLRQLVTDAALTLEVLQPLGGILTWVVGLGKSWVSLPGFKLFGGRWWRFVDTSLAPAYWLASRVDDRVAWLPSNYLVIARKRPIDGAAGPSRPSTLEA